MKDKLRTAESVSPKHPDKMCDRISDAIVDLYIAEDKNSRCAVETCGGHGIVHIIGEVTSGANISHEDIKHTIKKISGIENVTINIVKQSQEISQSVDYGGAGDQGIMVGYATSENSEMIPQELYLARNLCKTIYNIVPNDGKTQITLNDNNEITTCVCSFCGISIIDLTALVKDWLLNQRTAVNLDIFINPSGEWNIGGFDADAGVTGRKLVVDNYGAQVTIGGGAFSGKDLTKVDRSGAYLARNIAVKILKEQSAKEVVVKLAYAIGVINPVMINVIVDGESYDYTGEADFNKFKKRIMLSGIIFEKTAEWGAFGNGFLWDTI